MADHPTFQELRDGQAYRLARTGEVVTVVGPFIGGQPIYMRRADGTGIYGSTRELVRL